MLTRNMLCPLTYANIKLNKASNIAVHLSVVGSLRACLHGVGDPGLVGLVSFVFTLWGPQNKRNLPH